MFKCVQVCVRWSVDKKFLVFTQALCPQPILWSDYQGGSSSVPPTYFVIERRDAKIESRSKLKSHFVCFYFHFQSTQLLQNKIKWTIVLIKQLAYSDM